MADIRIMSYNVRSCLVQGFKHDPHRIAEVIRGFTPDIIALQEVDVGYKFKNGIDQAHTIAQLLEMEYQFHPSIEVEEGGYGNAILSRFPMKSVKAEALPRIKTGMKIKFLENILKVAHEPRGALWVEVDVDGVALQVVTTHLGLTRQERVLQMGALTDEKWMRNLDEKTPVVFCGDFNTTHSSMICKELVDHYQFKDAQQVDTKHQRKATFPSRLPLRCLDHIFVKGAVSIKGCIIPRNDLISKASDHLPVIADLKV